VLTVADSDLKDCLDENHEHYKKAVEFLKSLRTEYLGSNNYIEALLRK